MTMKSKGWHSKTPSEATGAIYDANGKKKFTFEGRWDQEIAIINVETRERKSIWKCRQIPPGFENYYFYSEYTMQLNYLNLELMKKICPTDSRLRPDQRALEFQNLKLAGEEKHRLEEKQRARRKLYVAENRIHKPRWFEEKFDIKTNEISYTYSGGYWEERENGKFTNVLDIYSDDL
jgi:oxysterol-binding protein 1